MVMRSLMAGETYFAIIKQKTFSTGFFDDACKEFYCRRLLVCQNAFRVELHAYVLMEKEIFLLFTPLTPSGFDSFATFLNSSYSRYYAIRFSRSVLAWRNDPLVCRLPGDKLVLDCQKFVERYAMGNSRESHPGEYGYSSYCANAFTHKPRFLRHHRVIHQLVTNEVNGLQRYRDFVAKPFREEYERFLQSRLLYGQPLIQQDRASRLENSRALADIEKRDILSTIT